MKKMGFTMVELIFVIVILGILAAVAIPKLMATRDDAIITKIRTDISNIRGAISSLHAKNLMEGKVNYPNALDDAEANKEEEELFDGNSTIGDLLDYPIYSKKSNGYWMKIDETNYTVKIMDNDIQFNYYKDDKGKFDCNSLNSGKADDICKKLTH